MRKPQSTTALCLFVALAGPSAAAGAELFPRYAFVRVEAGALRLDTETGEVSLCAASRGAATCTRVAENIRLTLGERAELEARIVRLEGRMRTLEAVAEEPRRPEEKAIERVDLLATRMMQHFLKIVRAVKQEVGRDEL